MSGSLGSNWLRDSLWSARISVMLRNSPIAVAKMTGTAVSVPCSQREADEMYRSMSRHFYDWTGQLLSDYRPAALTPAEDDKAQSGMGG